MGKVEKLERKRLEPGTFVSDSAGGVAIASLSVKITGENLKFKVI